MASRVLITDFDGTMTRRDFFRVALDRMNDEVVSDCWRAFEQGRLTHFEALRRIYSRISGGEAALREMMREMAFDPEAAESIRALNARGWSVVIASAGCAWYIERLLAGAGIAVAHDGTPAAPDGAPSVILHANPGRLTAKGGLELRLPEDSPYVTPSTGVDKEAIVRAALKTHECVAFAGDGRPDLACALLVHEEDRFARGWLARRLTEDGARYRPFDRWSEIAAWLTYAW